MPRKLLVLLAAVGVVVWSGCAETAPPSSGVDEPPLTDTSTDPKTQFVGNWELVRVERIRADGEHLPTPEPPSFGSDGAVGLLFDESVEDRLIMQSGFQQLAPLFLAEIVGGVAEDEMSRVLFHQLVSLVRRSLRISSSSFFLQRECRA